MSNKVMKDDTGQAINTTLQSLVGAISPAAANVTFDNTGTDLTSSDVEGAIKEVNAKFKIIKSVTFTATTSANGNLQLSSSITGLSYSMTFNNTIVLAAVVTDSSDKMVIPITWGFLTGAWGLRVETITQAGGGVGNTQLSFKLWYVEL